MGNVVKVTIAGAGYTLKTEESEKFTLELAKEIDDKIKEIKKANPFISTNQIAVLVALEYGCDCKKAEQNTASLRAEMKTILRMRLKLSRKEIFTKENLTA